MGVIGEAGSLRENTDFTGQALQVDFERALIDPVIAISGTNSGGNKFSFRVIEVLENAEGEATGFTFTIDEWENHDGRHPVVEDIQWLAIEAGVHTLPDGRVIEAGYSDADSDGEAVSLTGGFTDAPAVLTTVASDNFPSQVDSDPFDITASGFTLNVEEAESQDGVHGLERVGWIAIELGTVDTFGTAQSIDGINSAWTNNVDYEATYINPVVLVESQTQNIAAGETEDETGNVIIRNIDNSNVDIRFEEDTSVDGDTGHPDETIALVTFENGLIPCFTDGAKIATPYGSRAIETLCPGDLVLTRDAGPQPILWSAVTTVCGDDGFAPILIRAGAFGQGAPSCDMLVSPQHRVLLQGWKAQLYAGTEEVLVPAKALLNDTTVIRHPVPTIRYRHLLLAQHQVLTADGLLTESFHPGQVCKTYLSDRSRSELLALFPELAAANIGYGPLARPTLPVRLGRVFA